MNEIARNYPSQSLVLQCDLTKDQHLLDVKVTVTEKFGRLDILINCAGK